MDLKRAWAKHTTEIEFNYSVIAEFLSEFGTEMVFKPNAVIIFRGDFPTNVYFLKKGLATGLRDYEDGSDYNYFQIDESDGNIGLLEVMARKEQYIATITCVTEVTVIKVDSALIYQLIMSSPSLLRRCSVLLAEDLYNRSGNDGLFYKYNGLDRVRYYFIKYYENNTEFKRTGMLQIDHYYKNIANQIGVSIRTVGRSIKKLKELGEITSVNRKITISQAQIEKMQQRIPDYKAYEGESGRN